MSAFDDVNDLIANEVPPDQSGTPVSNYLEFVDISPLPSCESDSSTPPALRRNILAETNGSVVHADNNNTNDRSDTDKKSCDWTNSKVTYESGAVKIHNPPVISQPYLERVVTDRDIRYLKIFSSIAVLLFPPTGIAALLLTFKMDQNMKEGMVKGDLAVRMQGAVKRARKCERLIMLSVVAGLVLWVLVFALVEQANTTRAHDRWTFERRRP